MELPSDGTTKWRNYQVMALQADELPSASDAPSDRNTKRPTTSDGTTEWRN